MAENCEDVTSAKRGNPYRVFSLGIVAHELGHYLGALITGSKVLKIVLLNHDGGYVVHRRLSGLHSFVIALMPFFLGNLLAFMLFADAVRSLNSDNLWFFAVQLWLAISIALYARASDHDLKSAWKDADDVWNKSATVEKVFLIFVLPFVYFTLLIMEVRKLFTGPFMSWVWVMFIAVIAKTYVNMLG